MGRKWGALVHQWAKVSIAAHTIETDVPEANRSTEQNLLVVQGHEAQKKLCDFHDRLVCCDIDRQYSEYHAPANRDEMPMSKRHSEIVDHVLDMFNLAVCLQRHKCRPGFCLIRSQKGVICKYNFPKELAKKTWIKFSRKQKKDGTFMAFQLEIIGKRVNDHFISNHNQLIMKYLRVNHDLTIVCDPKRIIDYIAKYQTKCEKKSKFFESALEAVYNEQRVENRRTADSLRSVMMKVLGQRDVSLHEMIHILMSMVILNIFLFKNNSLLSFI
jgi:hypothetical protein